MNTVIRTVALCKRYDEASRFILDHIEMSIESGQSISIMGSSGSGKSTLLQLLGGLDTVTSGQIFWGHEEITHTSETERCTKRRTHIGYLYQFHHLLPEFSVLDNIAMPLMIQGLPRTEARAHAHTYASYIHLADRENAYPSALSGGERQRVALARALVTRPRCLLADEPTGNLDHDTAIQMADLLCDAQQRYGSALILVTHNPLIAARCQEHYQLTQGQLIKT